MEEIHDYIVVGSGCTGAMAAQTLVEKGVKVTMLDVGYTDMKYKSILPPKDYISIRKTEQEQYKYLIGENFEGLYWGNARKQGEFTPPRKFMIQDTDKYIPYQSENLFPIESLGYGGLGAGWGVGCCEFSKTELAEVGIDHNQMIPAYEIVAKRIGICGTKDDASPYTLGELSKFQPSLKMDRNHRAIFEKYTSNKKQFNEQGFYMGRPALAITTSKKEDRGEYRYRDMDFYSDADSSAYRPWMTIDKLKKSPDFSYIDKCLVLRFEEKEDHIQVECLSTDTNEKRSFYCKKLILASGVLGTSRIVLRSFNAYDTELPFLCNPYCYVPCIQPSMLGKQVEKEKVGFAQLSLFLDENKNNMDVTMASIYSYHSLMLFRIIKESSLNFSDSRILMRYLMPAFIILGIHHPERKRAGKTVKLSKSDSTITKDILVTDYTLTNEELEKVKLNEQKYIRAMRKMGVYALKRIDPGMGSSIHYAGTLPFSTEDKKFTLHPNGKLNGTKKVFVADGSGFNYLPAKGLTFSLMANAHRTALNVIENAG